MGVPFVNPISRLAVQTGAGRVLARFRFAVHFVRERVQNIQQQLLAQRVQLRHTDHLQQSEHETSEESTRKVNL